jgi:hypothetical protein
LVWIFEWKWQHDSRHSPVGTQQLSNWFGFFLLPCMQQSLSYIPMIPNKLEWKWQQDCIDSPVGTQQLSNLFGFLLLPCMQQSSSCIQMISNKLEWQ